jgi:RNA polymerase sigma factor (sigma-70 family)
LRHTVWDASYPGDKRKHFGVPSINEDGLMYILTTEIRCGQVHGERNMDKSMPNSKGTQLEDWYNEYYHLVRYHLLSQLGCNYDEVDDLIGEVFLRACRSLKSRTESVEFPKSWLLRIADTVWAKALDETGYHEVCYPTYYTTFDGEERSPMDDLADDPGYQPENVAELNEMRRLLKQELKKLPLEMRTAVVHHYIDGLTYDQIEAMYSHMRAARTFRNDVQDGIKRLRVRLNPVEPLQAEK